MSLAFRSNQPTAAEFAPYYGTYISKVAEGDITQILTKQRVESLSLIAQITPEQAAFRYAPGKWSVREVIGHLIDAERIFAYRALRIGRNDMTPLPGFDENAYVESADFESRSIASLTSDFDHVRLATLDLLMSFTEDAWLHTGIANANPVSVRAIAWIIAGHELHHRGILANRYLLKA